MSLMEGGPFQWLGDCPSLLNMATDIAWMLRQPAEVFFWMVCHLMEEYQVWGTYLLGSLLSKLYDGGPF